MVAYLLTSRLGNILTYVRSLALTIMFSFVFQITPTFAQVRQSPTPFIVNLITPTPFNIQRSVATVTSTFTATPKGPVLLEARDSSGNVNVRAEPDPDSDRLGSISFGTQYPVLRQFFSWYELQYDLSPSGRAWIYGELIDIIGDASEIEVVDTLEIAPTQNISDLRSTETWIAITSAPGGGQTATANARVLGVPTIIDGENVVIDLIATPLPTYTYPSDIIAIVPTQSNFLAGENNGQKQKTPASRIPPLLPIVILGGFGIIGLLINSLRR